jgi:hypothetical protein
VCERVLTAFLVSSTAHHGAGVNDSNVPLGQPTTVGIPASRRIGFRDSAYRFEGMKLKKRESNDIGKLNFSSDIGNKLNR